MTDAALEQIEIKIAYLERSTLDLSDVVFRQQREIQALHAQVEALRQRLDAGQAQEGAPSLDQELPPHY